MQNALPEPKRVNYVDVLLTGWPAAAAVEFFCAAAVLIAAINASNTGKTGEDAGFYDVRE